MKISLDVNGTRQDLDLDPRVTLLDALREHLGLTGAKKGCDHGQCGACTVLVEGRRINACLSLAAMHDGEEVVTIEGVADALAGTNDARFAAIQRAMIDNEGLQCGYCTPGQICSAIGMLREAAAGWPSHVTDDLTGEGRLRLDREEMSERMSGNLCRCGCYPGILAAIRIADGSGLTDGGLRSRNSPPDPLRDRPRLHSDGGGDGDKA